MIAATDVVVRYGSTVALDGVTATIDSGAMVGIVGPNGSGKTTLLRVVGGLQRLAAGEVRVDDCRWTAGSSRPPSLSRRVAVVPQDPQVSGQLRVVESVMLGRVVRRGPWARFRSEDWDAAAHALRDVDCLHLVDRGVASLSGGERQRVALARALAQQAPHLLLDEPTNHLDVRVQHELLDLVRSLDTTTVVVLHDLNLAGRYCDRLIVLDRGRVVGSGPPDAVLDPALVGAVYGIGAVRHDWHDHPHLCFALPADLPGSPVCGAGSSGSGMVSRPDSGRE